MGGDSHMLAGGGKGGIAEGMTEVPNSQVRQRHSVFLSDFWQKECLADRKGATSFVPKRSEAVFPVTTETCEVLIHS